jgi:3-deoxy-7-phosphoheptulonate synthase/chorismate mutase
MDWGFFLFSTTALHEKMDKVNDQLLELLNRRAEIVQHIGHIKQKQELQKFDPVREQQMLNDLSTKNEGPLSDSTIRYLFKQIFKASLNYKRNSRKTVC